MRFIKHIVILFLMSVFLFSLVGCSNENSVVPGEQTEVIVHGDDVLLCGYKIRSVVNIGSNLTQQECIFEVIVDGNGNGSGLFGCGDVIKKVIISNDILFIEADDEYITIEDINGKLFSNQIQLKGLYDVTSVGFTVNNEDISEYNYQVDDMNINTKYQNMNDIQEVIIMTQDKIMSLEDFVYYLNDLQEDKGSESNSEEVIEKTSFYNNSEYGIKIQDKIYSIGDYCNPSTYFENQTPEGLVPEYVQNKDIDVELLRTYYLSSDGKTQFTTTDGYVQRIETTSKFEFLKIYKGMPMEDLRNLLGLKLSKIEEENFKPIVPGLEVKQNSNEYILKFDNLTARIYIDSKTRVVYSISLSNNLEFLGE